MEGVAKKDDKKSNKKNNSSKAKKDDKKSDKKKYRKSRNRYSSKGGKVRDSNGHIPLFEVAIPLTNANPQTPSLYPGSLLLQPPLQEGVLPQPQG